MALQVAELSLELIETLRPLIPRIKAKDKPLADQIAWRYFPARDAEPALALLNRIKAILWKLTRG